MTTTTTHEGLYCRVATAASCAASVVYFTFSLQHGTRAYPQTVGSDIATLAHWPPGISQLAPVTNYGTLQDLEKTRFPRLYVMRNSGDP
ncbi:hypothetical protein M434DRAFT_400173 [Hypoxylon sp. CO27-5]|nr:hypothetical protein M434DRAFT_400173 [Hypoxylon sp. CO27-5]